MSAKPTPPSSGHGNRLFERIRTTLSPTKLYAAVVTILLLLIIPPTLRDLRFSQTQEPEGLRIRDLVRQVKQELSEADSIAQSHHEMALFDLEEFDLDVSFVVRSKNAATGKAGYELLAVESSTELSTERLQHIHLRWKAAAPESVRLATDPGLADDVPSIIGTIPPPKGLRR